MSLINRYIYAVTRSMSPATQKEVAKELRATIEDELEAKGGRTKKNINTVLTELGDPRLLAQQYKGRNNYLIGPDLYPLFIRILRLILIIVLPILFVVNLATGFSGGVDHIISLIGYALGHTISGAIATSFWVTISFVIVERSGVTLRDLEKDCEPWTPAMLPKAVGKYQIPISESVTNLVTYAVLIAAPFVAPHLVMARVEDATIPFFAPELWAAWTPAIIAVGVIGIAHSVWMLIAKRWKTLLTLFHVAFCVAVSVLLALILVNTPVVNEAFTQLIINNTTDVTPTQIEQWVSWSVAIGFIVTIGIYLYDAGKAVWLWRHPVTQG